MQTHLTEPVIHAAPDRRPTAEDAKEYRRIRREFYERLSGLLVSPTRATTTKGIAWCSQLPSGLRVFHEIFVYAKVGCFQQPERKGRPIPRICLNFCNPQISQTQRNKWSNPVWAKYAIGRCSFHLELTVTIEQLCDYASWIVQWVRAVENDSVDVVPDSPHPLQHNPDAPRVFRGDYLWTQAANEEYCRRNPYARALRMRHAQK